MGKQHLITKANLRATQWQATPPAPLQDGDVRLKIEAFALTANNVTYAAFGGAPMNYWHFFPTANDAMGRVPVWGFATVTESKAEGVAPGQRLYGYFPISEELVVSPMKTTDRGFFDGAAHRQALATIYNFYSFTATDPAYVEGTEPEQMLFRPLYMTGWMICDTLMEGDPKPDTAVISSASSKTAIAAAHCLQRRGVETVGVTSARNVDFVKGSGLYDQVLNYDEVASLQATRKTAYVDFVGRPALTKAVHAACGDHLIRSLIIGATDWEDDRAPIADLPGPQPEFFFVPDYAAHRAKQLPPGELDKRTGADLVAFYPASKAFVTPKPIVGQAAIEQAWIDTVEANIPADQGLVCSF
jgi:NADPH:quinone reductase-like Zn-dependent oxidoreductase